VSIQRNQIRKCSTQCKNSKRNQVKWSKNTSEETLLKFNIVSNFQCQSKFQLRIRQKLKLNVKFKNLEEGIQG
jgi:hypothetical protein